MQRLFEIEYKNIGQDDYYVDQIEFYVVAEDIHTAIAKRDDYFKNVLVPKSEQKRKEAMLDDLFDEADHPNLKDSLWQESAFGKMTSSFNIIKVRLSSSLTFFI